LLTRNFSKFLKKKGGGGGGKKKKKKKRGGGGGRQGINKLKCTVKRSYIGDHIFEFNLFYKDL